VGGVWTASGPIADVNALLAALTFTPAPNYNGNFTIATSVSDGTFTIAGIKNVTGVPVDDLPVAVNDAYAATEDTVLNVPALTGVLANDSGLGDGGIVLSVTAGPTNGIVTLNNDGSFIYTPNANSNGADSFTYQITDADGDTATATVTINVAAVNDPPIPLNNSFVITSGGTLVLSSTNLSATDVDSNPLTLVFTVSNVTNGWFEFVGLPGPIGAFTQAQILGGQVQFVHSGGGVPSFDLAVSDGSAITGPYAGNIVFNGGATPPPAPGGNSDVSAAIAGLFEASAPPPGAISGELAFASVPVAPLVLPAPLIGLSDRFGVAFTRTPTSATSAISETGAAGFAEAVPAAQAAQGPIDANIGADRGLPPIRVAGDVIETRIVDQGITVERLRADELEVRANEYAYACVPESVDPAPAALRAVPSERALESGADDRWRLDVTSGALTVTGLAVAAGVLTWAARASGLISGLLAAAPLRRERNPLPAPGRDKKKPRAEGGA
jgi:hypothetical protein